MTRPDSFRPLSNAAGRKLLEPSERELQEQCNGLLRLLVETGEVRAWYHPFDSRRSNPGYPDLTIALKDGRVLWVELKTTKGKLASAQMHWAHALGSRWALCRSFDDFRRELEWRGVRIGPR